MISINQCCETCLYWLPMGGCEFGGKQLCDNWKQSLTYEQRPQLELF